MHFDRSKGHCPEYYQAVFGFPKSLKPSQYGKGRYRVKTHLHSLFSITTGWAGVDEDLCSLRFYHTGAKGIYKPPVHLKPIIEELKKAHHGKSFSLEDEDEQGFRQSIKLLAGPVKKVVDYRQLAPSTPPPRRQGTSIGREVVGTKVLAAAPLKREVVDRYWGFKAEIGVCFGGCSKQMVYHDVHLAHWRPRGELDAANGFVAETAQVVRLSTHIVLFHS
jgi:hypothetical protein